MPGQHAECKHTEACRRLTQALAMLALAHALRLSARAHQLDHYHLQWRAKPGDPSLSCIRNHAQLHAGLLIAHTPARDLTVPTKICESKCTNMLKVASER
eukprot:2244614-Pleurochrysis_carterae.AAC.1